MESKIVVAFRGHKLEFELKDSLTDLDVKKAIIASFQESSASASLVPSDIKLIFKGKALENNHEGDPKIFLINILKPAGKKLYKMVAMGRSSNEVQEFQEHHAEARKRAPRIRDDLTRQGQQKEQQRKVLGKQMLQKAHQKAASGSSSPYGFGGIETLPNLPDEAKARAILTELANDPGILACMKKHKWQVGFLAELYPEGKVGETAVCVMGLNRNKGQQILLRIRTDNLQGFRKILSIRKVLYHELAHNVHSEHDGNFFTFMRQIEKECTEYDWTQGEGLSTDDYVGTPSYTGGTFRLGGNQRDGNDNDLQTTNDKVAARELRARAALERMTKEEMEIQEHCGCGREPKFLPPSLQSRPKSSNDGSCSDGEANKDAHNNDTSSGMDIS